MMAKNLALATILSASAAASPAQPSHKHTVSVTVHVVDQDGAAIEHVPLVATENGAVISGRAHETDASGTCVLEVTASDHAGEIVVMCDRPEAAYAPSDSQVPTVVSFRSLIRTRSFKRWYAVATTGLESSSSLTIVVPQAVAVKGKVLLPEGCPGIVFARGEGLSWGAAAAGAFELGGVPPGQTSTIFIQAECGDAVLSVPVAVPADADLAATRSLPDVKWPSPTEPSRPVCIKVHHAESLGVLYGPLTDSVSLVSLDGSRLYSFALNRATGVAESIADISRERFDEKEGALPRVAPGTYYVTVGDFISGGADLLYFAVKNGRGAQLDAAHVPTITVSASAVDPVATTIDGSAVWSAVRSIPQ
jgi:hypothetical protein